MNSMNFNAVKFLGLFGIIAFSLLSCKKDIEIVREMDEEGNLKVEYQRRIKDFAKQGWFKFYYPDGKIFEEAEYVENELHGTRKLFHENGNIQAEETYVQGNFEGPYKAYFPNGNPLREGQYRANSMDGDWKYYYETGQLKEIVRFNDNLENGPFEEYYPSGIVKARGTYLEGDNEHGELKLYDESGTLERVMDCEMGVCKTRKSGED